MLVHSVNLWRLPNPATKSARGAVQNRHVSTRTGPSVRNPPTHRREAPVRDGIVIRGSHVKMTPDMIEPAKQLYADGQSLAVIGERLRVDASTVHKVPKKAGVKMRDTHGRQNYGSALQLS